MSETTCVATFKSIHHVIKSESLLKAGELWTDMVPNPRTITTDCGMALVFHCKDIDLLKRILQEGTLEAAHIFKVNNGVYEELKGEETDGE
jgi:hypothetical protein